MKLDDALKVLGAYGKYQVLMFMIISLFNNLPSSWHMQSAAFLDYEPRHHCKLPPNSTLADAVPPSTSSSGRGSGSGLQQCRQYEYFNGSYSTNITACYDGRTFDTSIITSSVTSEWDLVCERHLQPVLSLTVFNLGVMFGAIVFGFLSDQFGRKTCFVFSLVAQSIVGCLTATSQNIYVFSFYRFIVGALEQGVNITGYIMAIELFPPKQRTIFGVGHEFIWAMGGAILPLFAYFLRDWRQLQLCLSLPGLLGLFLWWILPESTVWMLAKGRIEDAENNLERIAKFNKVPVLDHPLRDHHFDEKAKPKNTGSDTSQVGIETTYTILDLVRTPNLRKITICLCSLWGVNTTVYYGLTYNTPNLQGNMYMNFFILQMIEIPSVAVTMYLVYKYGRRWPLFWFHVLCGVVIIMSPFLTSISWLSITLVVIGKFSINGSFTIIYIYGPEIYPTVLRNTGAGLASFSGRMGNLVFPFIVITQGFESLGPIGSKLPLILFGCFSIIGGLLALPLPETRHNPLPETIEDVENYAEFCKRNAHLTSNRVQEMEPLREEKAV